MPLMQALAEHGERYLPAIERLDTLEGSSINFKAKRARCCIRRR